MYMQCTYCTCTNNNRFVERTYTVSTLLGAQGTVIAKTSIQCDHQGAPERFSCLILPRLAVSVRIPAHPPRSSQCVDPYILHVVHCVHLG